MWARSRSRLVHTERGPESDGRLRCDSIELYSDADLRSPVEPELEPEPTPLIAEPTIEILKPAFRSKTILGIILEKKNAKNRTGTFDQGTSI
jgi:hypothetical protein